MSLTFFVQLRQPKSQSNLQTKNEQVMQKRLEKEKRKCSDLEAGEPKIYTEKPSSLLRLLVLLMGLAAILWVLLNNEYWRRSDLIEKKGQLRLKVPGGIKLKANGIDHLVENGQYGAHEPEISTSGYPRKHLPVVDEPASDITGYPQYKKFFEKYCDHGSGSVSPWPKGDDTWQLRAPNFLIIGAKKAGTTSYWGKLQQHPFILPGKVKEMHSFQPKGLGQWNFPSQIGTKLNVEEARQTLYDTNTSCYHKHLLQRYSQLLSFEATPDYLLFSDISSHIILCTTPWAKILVTLRDPVKRLFSNYNFILQNIPSLNATFEEWFERDMDTLRLAGVIATGNEATKSTGNEDWWKHYQKISRFLTPECQVGRSLYVLQLEAWLRWMREAGRDPQKNLRVVWQEDLRQNPNRTLNNIAQWLGLPEHSFNTDTKLDMMVTNYSTTMAPVTRSNLERFFAPYNTRLQSLLQRERITF